nr:uncharacterized protein CTRU02_04849 [Colletotrichum truncatum]KAF6795287.1 hypothetical protein CTRU02_04849 [Colletotrichum truncatum]
MWMALTTATIPSTFPAGIFGHILPPNSTKRLQQRPRSC